MQVEQTTASNPDTMMMHKSASMILCSRGGGAGICWAKAGTWTCVGARSLVFFVIEKKIARMLAGECLHWL